MKKGILLNLLPDYFFNSLGNVGADLFSNIDLVVFDLDNTLVFPETCVSTKEIIRFLGEITRKNQCIILSNSKTASKRKNEIEKLFKCELFLSDNKKPFPSLFKEIDSKYDLKNKNFLVIGDRILTDILFGNMNGAATILIKPIAREKDIIGITKRIFENSLS